MITSRNKEFIIAREDYDLLSKYLKKNKTVPATETENPIIQIIENAKLIDEGDFPWEVVRLNSKVIIRDKMARINYTYTVVLPELADHKQCKVSVFSTIGSSLFASSRGDDIYWKTPNGKRYFTIMAVSQYTS